MTTKIKNRVYLSILTAGVLVILSGLIYSSCNTPVYAQRNEVLQDSTVTDSLVIVNIPQTRENLVEQLKKLEADKIKIIGILEFLDYLEKKKK